MTSNKQINEALQAGKVVVRTYYLHHNGKISSRQDYFLDTEEEGRARLLLTSVGVSARKPGYTGYMQVIKDGEYVTLLREDVE